MTKTDYSPFRYGAIILPVGWRVWYRNMFTREIVEERILRVYADKIEVAYHTPNSRFTAEQLGISVFLSKEDAEVNYAS